MKKEKDSKRKIRFTLDEAMRRNLIVFNNPVLVQGLALTPVVAATTSLKSAVILSLVAFILIIPTRFLGELLIGIVPRNLRPMVYSLIAAVCYIPAVLVAAYLFGTDVAAYGGNFVPMLVVDGIVLSRTEIPAREGVGQSLRNGFLTALGLAVVMLLVGAGRELLATGRIWGIPVLQQGPLVIAGTVAGGFLLVALLAALLQWGEAAYKRARGGARGDV